MRSERIKLSQLFFVNKNGDHVARRVYLNSAYDWLASKSDPDDYTVVFIMDKGYRMTGGDFLARFRKARTTDLPPCSCKYRWFMIWEHDEDCDRRIASGI